MGFDRRKAEVEQRGDFFVGSPFRQELEHFLFPIGQEVIRVRQAALLQLPDVVLDEHAGHGRAEEGFSRADRPDRRNQIFIGGAFQQVGPRARGERPDDLGLVAVHAQDDHTGRPIELLRSRGDLDAAQFRHADVEDDDVGLVLLAQPHGFQAVAGFGDDLLAG